MLHSELHNGGLCKEHSIVRLGLKFPAIVNLSVC
jgi:hypothetical protein